ncbi:MAG: hypothetical protein ACI4GX_00045 [Ruminococcus sp.]
MKDLKFTKEHVCVEFEESENAGNIKSGEPLGVIFGKIAKWISESNELFSGLENCIKREEFEKALGTVENGLSEVVDLTESSSEVKE